MYGKSVRRINIPIAVIKAYLTNIALPASILTGSTSFQDSFKVFFVSGDKETETGFNPTAGKLLEDPRR